MPARYPQRIVCLTEETTETLYLLGEERRIVGISGYTVRPPRARREKPRVSAFLSAKNDAILALHRMMERHEGAPLRGREAKEIGNDGQVFAPLVLAHGKMPSVHLR